MCGTDKVAGKTETCNHGNDSYNGQSAYMLMSPCENSGLKPV